MLYLKLLLIWQKIILQNLFISNYIIIRYSCSDFFLLVSSIKINIKFYVFINVICDRFKFILYKEMIIKNGNKHL